MKHSIKKIFKNLTTLWVLVTIVMGIGALNMIGQSISFNKINNLNNQKNIISKLIKLNRSDLEFAQIQFNGKSTEILNEIDKLRELSSYDFIGKYIINNSSEYMSDMDELAKLTMLLNEKASAYYTKNIKNKALKLQELQNAFEKTNTHINTVILKTISYEEIKFHIFEKIYFILFIIIFLTTIWYRKKLNAIYNDILFLFSVNAGKANHKIFSQEVDTILLRMNKKPLISDDYSLFDPVTEVHNLKGLYSSYSERKNLKDEHFTSVTVLEIDNISATDKNFTEEMTQTILKKIAFNISLYEQSTDVIARTGYNQFTIIFSRKKKEQSLKEIDAIRQSISQMQFLDKNKKQIPITISGGFIIKAQGTSLEDAIKQAKIVLQQAINSGKNKISHTSDLIQV